eukprot:jgi/Tetstr1/461110/TSEL_006249.t1
MEVQTNVADSAWADMPWCILQRVLAQLAVVDEPVAAVRLACSAWHRGHASHVGTLRPASGDSQDWPDLRRLGSAYPALQLLDLRDLQGGQHSRVHGELSSLLHAQPQLQALLLPAGQAVRFPWLRAIACHGGTLRRLCLRGVQELPAWGVALLGLGLPGLTALDISRVGGMEDAALLHLRPLLRLRELDISGKRAAPPGALPPPAQPPPTLPFRPFGIQRKGSDGLQGEGLEHLSSLGLLTLRAADSRATAAPALQTMLAPPGALSASLTELDISGGLHLPDAALHAIGQLPALTSLCMAGRFGWSPATFGKLAQATSLTKLDTNLCRWIVDEGLLPLHALAKLRQADMSHSVDLTPAGLAALDGWTAIQHLNLVAVIKISDGALCRHVSLRTTLRSLALSGCAGVTDTGVTSLSGLSSLRSLKLESLPRVSDSGGEALCSALRSLTYLSLRQCPNIGDKTVAAVVRNNPGLETLHVAHCRRISDAGLAAIARSAHLKTLDIRSIGPITDEGIRYLCGAPSLSALQLGWCSKVTDVGLGLVANFCKHLASLELYRLVGITDAGVELLRRMRPELQLSMYKCSLVSMRDL